MSDQKNFLYAFILSFAIFFSWDHFFGAKPTVQESVPQKTEQNLSANSVDIEQKEMLPTDNELIVTERTELVKDDRVNIETPCLKGSISLKGGVIDDLTLLKYKTSVKADAESINILNPKNTSDFYYIDFNTLMDDHGDAPTDKTMWAFSSSNQTLTPDNSVSIVFENSQGVRFERTYNIDDQYLITVNQKISNNAQSSIIIQNKATIKRHKPDLKDNSYILHEGAVGYIDNHLIERSYDDLSDKANEELKAKGGWAGFSDKYWLVALIPNAEAQTVFNLQNINKEQFIASLKLDKKTIQPGEAVEQTLHVYVGPKKLDLLDMYEDRLNIKKFDLAIDFGWFYFLTKPLFQLINMLYALVGNFGIAILIMTLMSKIVLFPLANKSYYSMGRMKSLAPKIEALKKKMEGDPMKMQQELMALYKREKVSPLSGCLPMLIQSPIFFCLYKVLYISIEMRHAPFYGWIHDLSAKDPTSLFNLFGLIPWNTPDFLTIGCLPIIMGATMVWQQKLNPQPADPAQAKMMLLMPIFFTFIFASFPAGLVLYWAFSNILSIAQQQVIMNIAKKKEK